MATGKKRLNPKTGKPFKAGDVRKDGYLFSGYNILKPKKDGFAAESWYHPDAFTKAQIKRRARDKEIYKEGVKRKRVKGQPITYELPKGTAREGLVSLKDVGVERLGKVIGKASVEKYGVNPFENLFASKEYSDFFREGIDLVKPTSEMWAQALKL